MRGLRWYVREAYGPVMWRRLWSAVAGLPAAGRSRRPLGLLTAVAAAAPALLLAFLLLINVVGYPFRPFIGLHGNDGGGIRAGTYHGSWGGPSLAGSWAVHAVQMMVLVFPVLAWATRGLVRLRNGLTGGDPRTVTA